MKNTIQDIIVKVNKSEAGFYDTVSLIISFNEKVILTNYNGLYGYSVRENKLMTLKPIPTRMPGITEVDLRQKIYEIDKIVLTNVSIISNKDQINNIELILKEKINSLLGMNIIKKVSIVLDSQNYADTILSINHEYDLTYKYDIHGYTYYESYGSNEHLVRNEKIKTNIK